MIYAITQFVKFDIDKEQERLITTFTGDKLNRQQQILQLFLDGDYPACYQAIARLPYDDENECDEAEYVHPFIFDNVRAIIEHPNIRIEPLHGHPASEEAKIGQ